MGGLGDERGDDGRVEVGADRAVVPRAVDHLLHGLD
jgi:hypothetical protein